MIRNLKNVYMLGACPLLLLFGIPKQPYKELQTGLLKMKVHVEQRPLQTCHFRTGLSYVFLSGPDG
jgi:hypothetical protein